MRKRGASRASSSGYSYSQTKPREGSDAINEVDDIRTKRQQCGYICQKRKTQVRVWLNHKDGGIAWDVWIIWKEKWWMHLL